MPYGLMPYTPAPEETSIPMETGSLLMLYTEARDVDAKEFFEERLKSFLDDSEKSAADCAEG